MTLAASQRAFLAEIAANDGDAGPSSLGMAIYRNAYRARLLAALETRYERTRRWVGADAFAAAAAHYILADPPTSWTLDVYGANFPALLATLFAQDPEVAELAWLEWHLQQAFAAPDLPELSAAQLAQAGLADDAWKLLGLTMAAGFAARPILHDCTGLWQQLQDPELGKLVPRDGTPATLPATLVVWRTARRPHYRVLDKAEYAALDHLAKGGTFGGALALAANADPARFGGWFAQWLSEGLFSGFSLNTADVSARRS